MARHSFDIAVLGGGPGGYVAAIRAAQLGMKACVVEREHLGGICLNWGCIPTKALLRTSEINHLLGNLDAFGFAAESVAFDLEKIVQRSREVAGRLTAGVSHLLRKNEVAVIEGHGRLEGPGKLAVERDGARSEEIEAPHIVLATGARARTLPGLEPDGERIWTYREAMVPREMPSSLLVIGSGAIGIEFASFYRDLGAEVTVVEILERILPVEDEEISSIARKAFENQGIEILTGASVTALEPEDAGVAATIESGEESRRVTVDKAILAVGIAGNVEDIGLEGTAVDVDRGHVVVNSWNETGEAGVYAIGDLVGPPWLAHKASHEGVICVERIAGMETRPLDVSGIRAAPIAGRRSRASASPRPRRKRPATRSRIGRFPYLANGKAIALGDDEGMVKTVFDASTGALLGAHMIGAEVTELIQGFAIAMTLETTEAELMETVFPHPTLSETMHESVLDAYGRALHF